MPFTTQTLKEYFKEIGWTEDNYYSNLNSWSRDLINFPIPSTLSISLGKNITQHLKSAYTLSSSGDNSFAFISSSETIDSEDLQLQYRNPVLKEPLSHWNPSTFLYGRLHRDGRLETLACRTLRQDVMLVGSALSAWKPDPPLNLNFQLLYSKPGFSGEVNYNSDNHIFGFSSLGILTKNWALGGEAYYTAKENSGGLTLATRMSRFVGDSLRSATTFILNPIMGHLSFSHSLNVRPHISVTSHYDFNIFSYESDFTVGIQLSPNNHDQILQASLSIANGLGICFSGKMRQFLYKIGMQSQFEPSSPKQIFGVSIELL